MEMMDQFLHTLRAERTDTPHLLIRIRISVDGGQNYERVNHHVINSVLYPVNKTVRLKLKRNSNVARSEKGQNS